MAWTLLIRNGTVVDGSGAPGYAADVAVEGDRIGAIERRPGGGGPAGDAPAGGPPAPGHPARKAVTAAWIGEIGSRLAVEWETFGQYLERLRQAKPSINIVHFVGPRALRPAAPGPADPPPPARGAQAR